MRAITPTRCLAVLIALSCLLVFALVPRYDLLEEGPRNHVARGDLLEVVPASYGVHSQAYHFWDGPGRKHGDVDGDAEPGSERNENNFYENYAEDTKGKRHVGYSEASDEMNAQMDAKINAEANAEAIAEARVQARGGPK
ncbi:hypothetical protein EWM64_g8353 [Hericium alpestre]|uniref:Uncharacterized protein n=1 Tax=Hericium alpestre TaxID=135208 RepID=A0A4Y9ZN20_9AGAM|nr:hypothetical protein EWM64_g8353 [Hericium alpestre]